MSCVTMGPLTVANVGLSGGGNIAAVIVGTDTLLLHAPGELSWTLLLRWMDNWFHSNTILIAILVAVKVVRVECRLHTLGRDTTGRGLVGALVGCWTGDRVNMSPSHMVDGRDLSFHASLMVSTRNRSWFANKQLRLRPW